MHTAAITAPPERAGIDSAALKRADALLDGYVERGNLPGYHLVIARRGEVVHSTTSGWRDVEARTPVTADTLWRIYSMTKPITSIAVMRLFEQGRLLLTDPISKYLPEFADQRVYVNGSDLKMVTVPTSEPVRIWHLLTHTSGLTYGFHRVHPVDALLRAKGYEWGSPDGVDLAAAVRFLASLPLLFTPGTEYNYSLATDVLGRLVEVLTDQRLDVAIEELVTGPVGMTQTRFHVPPDDAARLGKLYVATGGGGMAVNRQLGEAVLNPQMLSGGGGLVSTAGDYLRFTQMLARGGELDGVRIIGPRTLAMMTRNHLPGNADIHSFGRPVFAEIPQHGMGFGLGFAVVIDPVATRMASSLGEYNWGGAASTTFWVDPVEQLQVVFMTALLPSSTYPLRPQLRSLIYGALRD